MIFLAKDIEAGRVNLIMNDFAAGLPSPLSFLGLADSLIRNLKLSPWTGRVIPILHEVTPSTGRTKPEMDKKGTRFGPIETVEDMHGSVRVSLVLDLPGCTDALMISNALSSKRIAGGTIKNHQIEVVPAPRDGSLFKQVRRGYAVVRPETKARLAVSRGDEDGLTHIAKQLYPAEKGKGFGWIVPCAAGYRLLEDPKTVPRRAGTRNPSIAHVFAEPLVGIAELISVRNPRVSNATTDCIDDLFWGWSVRENLIFGHPSFNLI